MPPREVDEVSIRLGEVAAKLKAIEDIACSERETARQHRVDLKAVVEALSASVREMASRLTEIASREGNVHNRLAQAEELTQDYREQRDKARGRLEVANTVRNVIMILTSIIAAAAAYFGMVHNK